MSKVTISQEFQVSTAEHEILLSFVNDEDAVLFAEWWEDGGEELFLAALPRLKKEYNE